jgi:hypothetical protein
MLVFFPCKVTHHHHNKDSGLFQMWHFFRKYFSMIKLKAHRRMVVEQ